jgi:hypothetical protein
MSQKFSFTKIMMENKSPRIRTFLGDTSFEIYTYVRKKIPTCTAPHDNMQSWQCLCGGGLKLLKWNVPPCPPGV